MRPQIRPYSVIGALRYAVEAGVAHYRFARRDWRRDLIPSLIVPTKPSQREMDTAGIRWCDMARMEGSQPVDPALIWRDVAMLWAAYHAAQRNGEDDQA